jgi:hypothetical protein
MPFFGAKTFFSISIISIALEAIERSTLSAGEITIFSIIYHKYD